MTRLDLPNGMWLDVKEDVKVKDKRDAYEFSGLEATQGGQVLNVAQLQRHQIGLAAIWIAGWSVIADGKAVPWPGERATFKNRVSALDELPGRLFDLVTEAVTKYVNDRDAELVTEKNGTLAGATT